MKPSSIRSRHPHPAMKWTLLVGFVAVLVLGVPHKAAASTPNVKPPTGPSNGSYFTGTYSFETYIFCQSGLSLQSSYSNALEGTHTFSFDGGDDGSLMVRIDGGGDQIIYSCGDPTPSILAASYTVSRDTTNPSASISSPADGSSTSSGTIDVAISAGDSTSGVGSVSVNGTSANFSGGVWHATVGLNVGSNNLVATVADRAGNTSTDQLTVTRRASSPSPAPPPAGGGTNPAPHPSATPVPSSNSQSTATVDSTPTPVVSTASTPAPAPTTSVVQATPVFRPHPTKPAPIRTGINWMSWLVKLLASLPLLGIIGVVVGVRSVRHSIVLMFHLARIRLHPYYFKLKMILRGYAHDIPRSRHISDHKHTGKVLAHHHTSYPALAFLLLCTTILSGAVAFSSHAADETLSLTVLGPPPSSPASISSPVDGDVVTSQTIQVQGTCPTGLVVEIYRDGGFAGSGSCDVNGLFVVSISLNPGLNSLVARDADGLGQYGPDSNTVGVTYNPPPPPPSPSPSPIILPPVSPSLSPGVATTKPIAKSKQSTGTANVPPALSIDSDQHYFQGINPGESIKWQLKILNGTPPFKVAWNWGDGTKDVISTTDRTTTSPSHTYDSPGYYRITATVQDAAGHTAILQVLAIVKGSPTPIATTSKPDFGNLMPVWPLLFGMILLVMSFWLGERTFKDQHHVLRPQGS